MGAPINIQNGGNIADVLQQSLDSFMNSGQSTQGTPATAEFIQNLKKIKGHEIVEAKDCQVCFEKFKDEDTVNKLPCKHLFHTDCINPWFQGHNTCPVCRMEMPNN